MANEEFLMRIQMMQQQAEKLEEQLQAVKQQKEELIDLKESLGKVKGEFLSSLGKGIFVKSEVKEKDFFVNIGEKVLIKKTPEETQKIIGEQIVKLEEIRNILLGEIDKSNKEMRELIEEIRKISS